MRVASSGDVWQFRMWISEEGKYIRKSLRTRDYESAVERAEKIVFETMSDIKTGRRIFGLTIDELCDEYIKWRREDVSVGNITSGRLITIQSQLKHLVKYKSGDLKISELDRNSLYDYANWRKKTKEGTRDVTIRNEQATFNHMMNMAWRNGLSHFDKFNFRVMRINQDVEVQRRGIFDLDEYDRLVRFMRKYVSRENCVDDYIRDERLMVRDCVLIASNTMLRVGELWNLKWGDIKRIEQVVDSNARTMKLVHIRVRAETSKVRKSRQVVSRGGEYFSRLKERSRYTDDDDWVFASVNGQSKISKQKWYNHWKELMIGTGIDYRKRNITWYSLRHFGITCRLRAGVSHFDISKLAGTSVANIEKHYGHIDTQMLRSAAMRSFEIDKDGLLVATE
jgi:integrase